HTDCTSSLDFSTPVVLQATPLDGFTFVNWTGTICNGVANSTNSTCSFKVPNGNVNIVPNYRRTTLVRVFGTGTGTGTITSTPAGIACNLASPTAAMCSETFFDGKPVSLSA